MPSKAEIKAFGQYALRLPEVWMPDTTPILPERRLLVPEPAIKFDKLTPAQMGEAHGRIAERPPIEMVHRLHGLSFDSNTGLFLRSEKFASDGIDYIRGYSESITKWLLERGASKKDLADYNPAVLYDRTHLAGYIAGMDRVPYGEDHLTYPDGYVLGFAVGVTRDFGLPVNLTDVPENDSSYDAFLAGLSGAKVPKYSSAMWSSASERLGFKLGVDINEIAEIEPSPQAA